MTTLAADEIQFPTGNTARLLRVSSETPIERIIAALELPPARAVLMLNGGTAELGPDMKAQLDRILQEGIALVASEEQITIITGGTDAGIFAMLGQGIARWGRTAPCIGVV